MRVAYNIKSVNILQTGSFCIELNNDVVQLNLLCLTERVVFKLFYKVSKIEINCFMRKQRVNKFAHLYLKMTTGCNSNKYN